MENKIYKIGAAIIRDYKILVVRESGWKDYGVPGGTLKENESDEDCLVREIREELDVSIKKGSMEYVGTYEDVAQNEPNTIVQIKLYRIGLEKDPSKTPEIEDMFWFGKSDDLEKLGPTDKNHIIPALIEKGLIK